MVDVPDLSHAGRSAELTQLLHTRVTIRKSNDGNTAAMYR